jgi:hypothetical protein
MELAMDHPTRRDAFHQTASLTLLTALGGLAPDAKAEGSDKVGKSERERVMAVGFTEAEAECWETHR